MKAQRYQIIFLSDSAVPTIYKSTPKNIQHAIPIRDRTLHAEKILKLFENAWMQSKINADERQVFSLPTRQGTYLEFKGAAGFDLSTKSLEDFQSGIRLRSIRKDELTKTTIATVYVPKGKEQRFLKKIREYALENTWQQGQRNSDIYSPSINDGTYLEIQGEFEYDFQKMSLEESYKGIRLLSAHNDNSTNTTVTTVFVPIRKKVRFLKKIRENAKEKLKILHEPKYQSLMDSIEDIRLAILESSFWQDAPGLRPDIQPVWCEVWLHGDNISIEESFRLLAESMSIKCGEGALRFPERTVMVLLATAKQLCDLIDACDYIAEFRRVKETARFILNLDNKDQAAWARDALARLHVIPNSNVSVCILDTGANNGHPLLAPVLADNDCHSYRKEWGRHDHDGHGTLMCGLAAYGDLQIALEDRRPIIIAHRLESVKILPPDDENDAKLYGHITTRSVSKTEIESPERIHINCMAITALDGRDCGRPSSWSAAIDALTSGYIDDEKRLFIISAGNVYGNEEWSGYPGTNQTNAIHDPAQAWNSITVGAYTEKVIIRDPTFAGYTPLAQVGELSPHSTTTLTWELNKWPVKPDIVLEGGNLAISPDGKFVSECDDLSLLSTCYQYNQRHFNSINATSAAAAQAAYMAARIQTQYPLAWPETVRGLMIHSAEWTPAMRRQFLTTEKKTDKRTLLRTCGYGVPDLKRAITCASNRLTLIAQETFSLSFRKIVKHK